MNVILAKLTLAILVTFLQVGPDRPWTGQISGKITYGDGSAAANMQVLVLVPEIRFKKYSITDEKGQYRLDGLPLGDVVLYPYNYTELYPLRADMFLASNPDRVVLTKEQSIVQKDITVPPKAAIIEGTAVSKRGIPVPGAQIVLCHSDAVWRSAEIHSDEEGRFRYVVPSKEPLSVYVRSGDYAPVQRSGISLAPGETRSMKFTIAISADGGAASIEGEACKPFRPQGQ